MAVADPETQYAYKQAVVDLLQTAAHGLIEHRNSDYPNEAVGLLCADGAIYKLINQARSAKRFEVSELLVNEALLYLESRDHLPIAMYHSHPEASCGPSRRDISWMETMPGAISVIVGQDGIAAWRWVGELESVGRIPFPEMSRF